MKVLHRIPVFFSPHMVADSHSFSPSAGKPTAVVSSWQALGLPLDIREPEPVTVDQLKLAHDESFVDGVLSCEEYNGFGNRSAEVAASLPYTSGAMLAAACEAIANGAVAVAPVSGFHHAHYAGPEGYCTFNGLIVAARVLLGEGAMRIGILDFDQHYGNGTDDCIKELKLSRKIRHYTAGKHFWRREQAAEFLEEIADLVRAMKDCDVILYQAGADPHVDDPLGGWLTTAQLADRDWRVFSAASRYGIPLAWNLAGGYQTPIRKVLDIHDQTMLACAQTYLQPERS